MIADCELALRASVEIALAIYEIARAPRCRRAAHFADEPAMMRRMRIPAL